VVGLLNTRVEVVMNALNVLTQEHFLESEARQRHVDELMAMPRQTAAKGLVVPHDRPDGHLGHADGDLSAAGPGGSRGLPRAAGPQVAGRAEGLNGALKVAGLEFEKALVAVLVTGLK
jgi:hypothetical protein